MVIELGKELDWRFHLNAVHYMNPHFTYLLGRT